MFKELGLLSLGSSGIALISPLQHYHLHLLWSYLLEALLCYIATFQFN